MFEKNLNDLVRGIRNNKANEAKYIAQCLDDIKQELRQENVTVKANAVSKLTYLQMLGYDISWAAFNIIEVMSSTKFTLKRIGYLAASQCFHEDLDVLMLTTNLIKKDMASQNQYDAGVAINGLSCFITPDLARDLANDIMNLMISSRPYMRKKAVLLMFKVFLNFPEALRPAFPRLKEKLEDSDAGVQCAAVNVICELARKNPQIYLSLAPLFFKLMTTSCNNWMLIKIIKLFGALCPLEPRLGKKLMEPLTSFIHSTSAMSLLYECINTVISGLPEHMPSIQLCVSKLKLLIEDPDQNLKYLGLLALNKILKKQPKAVLPLKDMIIQCLDDRDESIRYRSLDLIVGMVSKKTLVDIVKKLMVHIEKSEGSGYRDELVSKIIQICSQSNYQYITNFEWYIDTLIQLCCVDGTKHGTLIASQMLDVTIRVRAIRPYAVTNLSLLLSRTQLYSGNSQKDGNCEVLYAAAWLVGEYSPLLADASSVLTTMMNPRVSSLPGHIQSVFVQSIAKLLVKQLAKVEDKGDSGEFSAGQAVMEYLQTFAQSSDLEVQERACCILELVKMIVQLKAEGISCAKEAGSFFEEELLPVAPKAQKKVPLPEGLDLDEWINEPPSESSSGNEDDTPVFADLKEEEPQHIEIDEEELQRRREARKQLQASNPHYLKVESPKKGETVDDIPVKKLDINLSLRIEGDDTKSRSKKRRKKGKREGRPTDEEDSMHSVPYEVTPVMDVEVNDPGQGVAFEETEKSDPSDPHRLLNIDLDKPLEEHEVLPVLTHRSVPVSKAEGEENGKEQKSKKDVHKKKHKRHRDDESKRTKEKGKRVRSRSKLQGKTKDADMEKNKSANKVTLLSQASLVRKSQEIFTKVTAQKTSGDEPGFDYVLQSESSNLVTKSAVSNYVKSACFEEKTKMSVDDLDIPHEKKGKAEKERVGEKKKKKKTKVADPAESVEHPVTREMAGEEMLLDSQVQSDPHSHYQALSEDARLKLVYDIKVNPMKCNEVIASIIFRNCSDSHVTSMEFNVIDSLNMKLIRSIGSSFHDPVQVPFQLPPGMTNEGQFAFTVDSIVMTQWLRGTLTYIFKTSEGSTSEKIDFKINFPVHAYVLQTPISGEDFAHLLASGELTEKQSTKICVQKDTSFKLLIKEICKSAQLSVVEMLDTSASLYGYTIQHHPICLLVKNQGENAITIDAKSTNYQLLSSLLNEIKNCLKDQ